MLQNEIQQQRHDLNTYTANQSVYIFKEGQEITLKCVPINESEGTHWLCYEQDRNAEVLHYYSGGKTVKQIISILNKLFPKPKQ